jgi:hypothetical protein
MKVISFSLYGDNPKYIVGAAKNILLAREHYPDWVCRFYCTRNAYGLLYSWLYQYQDKFPIFETVICEAFGYEPIPPMIWRFLVADDPEVERFIVRDSDSRIGAREAAAVQEWEQSGLLFHSMRDHAAHGRGLNGGMWGGIWRNQNWAAPRMIDLWNKWVLDYQADYHAAGHTDDDQGFLKQMVWPWVQNSLMQHDSVCRHHYPGARPFPTKRDWPRFVGEVWNELDQPRDGDWQQILKDQE